MAALARGAHSVTLSSDLIKDWRSQQVAMHRIADAMPEFDFGFRPTPPQRSFGGQLLHVAHTNLQLLKCLGSHAALPRLPEDGSAKPDILRALDGSYEYGVVVIGGFSNVVLLQA